MRHDLVRVKIRDTQTGAEAWDDGSAVVWWWADGNGSCDCNRQLLFNPDAFAGEVRTFNCLGCHRYIVVDLEGIHDPQAKAKAIAWMNEGYGR